ncbi:hypothetical protein [Saccharopolyspora rosea]|uniref:Sporulation protein n=1 Tax=Saccharopolyspora rosea TaxID=524884 RepID=A0ABW3FJC7_9PSEU|nr:hypothetical protein [Saccharopolyspora rosea]
MGHEEHDRDDALAELADRLGRNHVFGEPVHRGEVTLVPVAAVRAGAGGAGRRAGRGAGVVARPVGSFEISGGGVRWHPAVNVNRIVLGGQIAFAVAAISLAFALRRR